MDRLDADHHNKRQSVLGMKDSAFRIQNPATQKGRSRQRNPARVHVQTGFSFDAPGSFILKSCALCDRWRPAGTFRSQGFPPPDWVLDYALDSAPDFAFACGTETSGLVPRPVRVAHLYPPGTPYLESGAAGGRIRSAWMIFSSDFAFLRAMVDAPAGFARIHDPSGVVGAKLVAMAEAAAGGSRRYCDCAAKGLEILSVLQGAARVGNSGFDYGVGGATGHETIGRRVLHCLERRYCEPVSLPDIAHELGVSVSTLAHRFREETGETVVQALRRIRLEQSRPYLIRGASVKEVAAAVGFSTPFYFSKVFRDHCGVPPSASRCADRAAGLRAARCKRRPRSQPGFDERLDESV